MKKSAIPARLVELAERWASPVAWRTLCEHYRDAKQRAAARDRLNASRARLVKELSRRPDRRDWIEREIAELDDLIGKEARDAELFGRLNLELRSELLDLGSLLRTHAPDLIGDVPTIDLAANNTDDRLGEFAQSVKRVLGHLLARHVLEWYGPLRVNQWEAVFDCGRTEIAKRLKSLEAEGKVSGTRQARSVKAEALTERQRDHVKRLLN